MGNTTVGELQPRLSAEEFTDWEGWEEVHGPLLLHERIDAGFARMTAAIVGGSPAEFMPAWDEKAARADDTTEGMISRLQALKKRRKKGKR